MTSAGRLDQREVKADSLIERAREVDRDEARAVRDRRQAITEKLETAFELRRTRVRSSSMTTGRLDSPSPERSVLLCDGTRRTCPSGSLSCREETAC
jgi:hypothetical protein